MKLWIARDKDGAVYAHRTHPRKEGNMFFSNRSMYLGNTNFPEVTWENSPKQVELKLIEG